MKEFIIMLVNSVMAEGNFLKPVESFMSESYIS